MPQEIKHTTTDLKKYIFITFEAFIFHQKYTESGINLFKATFILHRTNYKITCEMTFNINPLHQPRRNQFSHFEHEAYEWKANNKK
jgi:hypothetical protein